MSSKIEHIGRFLSSYDVKKIKDILSSGFYGDAEDLILILQHLATSGVIDRKWINIQLYGKYIPSHDVKVRLAISQLYQIIEQYLLIQEMEERSPGYELKLLTLFRQQNDHKLFKNKYQQIQRQIDASPVQDLDFYHHQLILQQEKYAFESSSRRSEDHNLTQILQLIDIRHILEKLKYTCYALMHSQVYKKEMNLTEVNELINTVDHASYQNYPAIIIYTLCARMLLDLNNEDIFKEYTEAITSHVDIFSGEEFLSLYLLAINYCIRRQNIGDQKYTQIALDLYRKGLDRNIFTQNDMMTRFTYKNIIMLAIKVKEFEWARTFTDRYKDYLKKEEKESAYQFNLALIAYHHQDYDAALTSIRQVDFNDHLINLSAKILQLKIYFENKEFMLLHSHLDALQMYVLRKKILGYHRANIKNIIKYTKKLMKVDLIKKEQKEKLKEKIQQENPLTEKEWMLGYL